jgi:hypothetical protein
MDDCLQGGLITIDHKSLYDLRYFYVQEQHGHYTCGVVFETMISLLREHRFQHFNSSHWYKAVSETKNPIVRGFIAEQICLNKISMDGLPMVASYLTRMEVVPFRAQPEWGRQLRDSLTLQLYTPTTYNFPNIDAIILWLNLESKSAHLYPIQITLSRVHKNSEDLFYSDVWRSWVDPIETAGFEVSSTFVWIDKEQPADQYKEAVTLSTRQGEKLVQPAHRSIHVGIGQVDVVLAKKLSL